MSQKTANAWKTIIVSSAAAIATVIGALAVAGVFDNAPAATEAKAVVPEAIVVDKADADAKPDDIVQLGPNAREVLADYVENDGHDLAPEDGNELRGDDERGPVAELKPPYAAEEIPGCRTRFFTTNFSARTVPYPSGVIWVTWHYTAGPDIPNSRADVDGLTGFGNNPAARVSWQIGMDKDGNCDYNVPLRYKSWAFGNANSRTYNIEVTGQGEAPYLRAGGYAQAVRILRYIREANPGIPVRVGSVVNCGPGSAGQVTHWMGGPCSGGHTDIRPHDFAAFVRKLRAAYEAATCDQVCKQAKVVESRVANHREKHAEYRRAGCRRGMHGQRLRTYTRKDCRKLKRQAHAQHLGISRARRKLGQLRAAA